MPFVLSPNLWNRVTHDSSRKVKPLERAHGDGIYVDFDSPEGFEEVFWRTLDNATINSECYGGNPPTNEDLASFSDYRALVANPRNHVSASNSSLKRYLSKNNNNLLRLSSLMADPTATGLIVYRDPIATATSLHRQHLRFCEKQTLDPFVLTYMNWLGHHEFGFGHRPFCFAASQMDLSLEPIDINYWLDYWDAVYCYVLKTLSRGMYLVNHDVLCAEPERALLEIFSKLSISADVSSMARQINLKTQRSSPNDNIHPRLLKKVTITHDLLKKSNRNIVENI